MKMWARVQNGQIVQGPLGFPEYFFSKEEKNSEVVAKMSATESPWLPVIDNSLEVDLTTTAVSSDYKIEILPDRILKTHKTRPFPKEFIEAHAQLTAKIKPGGSEE